MANGDDPLETLQMEPEQSTAQAALPDEELSVEERIDLYLQGLGGGQDEQQPDVPRRISGVPEEHTALRYGQGPPRPAPPGPPVQQDDGTWRWADGTVTSQPIWESSDPVFPGNQLYRQGDQFDPASWTEERRARLQADLARLGLVPEDVKLGTRWSEDWAEAFKPVLVYADINGMSWQDAIGDGLRNPDLFATAGTRGKAAPYVDKVYMAPDYTTLSQRVKEAARERLGRDLRDYEVKLLADELGGGYQQQIAQSKVADRAQYEAQQSGGEAPVLEETDPQAAFRAKFEELYRPELETLEAEEEAARTQQIAGGGANLLRRMIGT